MLSEGVSGGCLDFFLSSTISLFLSSSLWETARYTETEILSQRAVKPKTTNQIIKV